MTLRSYSTAKYNDYIYIYIVIIIIIRRRRRIILLLLLWSIMNLEPILDLLLPLVELILYIYILYLLFKIIVS